MTVLLHLLGIVDGILIGYIIWAPTTPFKKGLVDGLSLSFLWRKK